MTPKQKAIELIEKYQNIEFEAEGLDDYLEPNTKNMGFEKVKQCCLITIDEIIKEVEPYSTDYSVGHGFLQKVKEELLLF